MKNISIAIAFAAASLASSGALAQSYVTGAVGQGRHDLGCAGAAVCDETGTAFKLVGGHEFGNNWAVELGYIHFGKSKAADSGVSLDTKVAGLMAAAAYQAQFTPEFGMAARLGLAYVKTSLSATVSGVGSASDSDNNVAPFLGLGVNYALNKQMKVELGADWSKAEFDGDKMTVRAVTVGLRYAF